MKARISFDKLFRAFLALVKYFTRLKICLIFKDEFVEK